MLYQLRWNPLMRLFGWRKRAAFHIEHSGHEFVTSVEAHVPDGWGWVPVWPIQELLVRAPSYSWCRRIYVRVMNPFGKPEAAACIGFIQPT